MPRDTPRRNRHNDRGSDGRQSRDREDERERYRDTTRERGQDGNRIRDRERQRDSYGTERRHRRRGASTSNNQQRHRRGHRATDSTGELLPRAASFAGRSSPNESPNPKKASSGKGSPLSAGSLAKLDAFNEKNGWHAYDYDAKYLAEVREKETKWERERVKEEKREMRGQERRRRREEDENKWDERGKMWDFTDSPHGKIAAQARDERAGPRKKRRIVSGPYLEEGGHEQAYAHQEKKQDGDDEEWARRKRKRICVITTISIIILAIIIPVAVVMSKKKNDDSPSSTSGGSKAPSNSNLNGIAESDIPASARGTYFDPFTWYDTEDFNVTYTDATVGGLPIMGLNSSWNDNVQANSNVPSIKDKFNYGEMPIRGINVGGWLSLEPFITPSFFSSYNSHDGVIDEYTLTSKLGSSKAASTLEQHYSSFITKQTFIDIREAGFDHVRIPFSYWAVTTYDGDPYVPKISWRYLLRGIEYCRQNGLRVNLDLHGAPGSQNGWNHSGRQGVIGWLNGTNGDLNAQRTLDIHNQLSAFFAQPRYKNIITMYGLVNEPRMVALNTDSVIAWTEKAISTVRKNNITAVLVFGDGFLGLDNWQGRLQTDDNLLLDVHQYVIFNTEQIALKHSDKLNFACKGWTAQTLRSENKNTGFGPTLCGEWSQADTDCTRYINNVGAGSRWEGTLNTGNASTSVLTPVCPLKSSQCSCNSANADPSNYSDAYKQWLRSFAEAQMESFERGWGWFYWTWITEGAVQWSWKLGMDAGILPTKVWDRAFNCNDSIPDYGAMGLSENY